MAKLMVSRVLPKSTGTMDDDRLAEQYVTAGRAARLLTSLGLHREPTCQLRQCKDEGLRVLFWTTYIVEKTISLWQGRPSCLNVAEEIDTALPKAGDVCMDACSSSHLSG
jgi:hypothetical protein